jgi:hypothetical protein
MTTKVTTNPMAGATTTPSEAERSDEVKKWEDLILILEIVFAIIVCLGEEDHLTAVQMGGISLGILGTRTIIEIVILCKEGVSEHKTTASKIISLLCYLALFANIGLSTAVTMEKFSVVTVAWIMLGLELGTRLLEQVAHRTCGSNKKRYSMFQVETAQPQLSIRGKNDSGVVSAKSK